MSSKAVVVDSQHLGWRGIGTGGKEGPGTPDGDVGRV